jgi:putative oxidoreductase
MKYAVIVVRVLIGLLFLLASVMYFINPSAPPPEGLTGDTKLFMDGLAASKYIMPVSKIVELLCGLAFVSGRFVALAVVLIFPIALNILLINAIHLPSGLPIAIPLLAGILFLAYANREKYMPLFSAK